MDPKNSFTLKDLLLYFLRLGAFKFGGPVALAAAMEKDLVEKKKWISEEDYVEGFALAQLAPGPLATQLAIYIGWIKARILGATLVAIAFILPSFLMVIALAALYLQFGGLPWIQGAFYGVGAAVIAVIVQGAHKLTIRTLKKDWLLWIFALVAAVITIVTETEFFWMFIASGFLAVVIKNPPKWPGRVSVLFPTGVGLFYQLHSNSSETLKDMALFFTKAGAMVFGSGLVIVPFLHGGVVQEYGWLNERQFLDAVAVAMITPGPIVITVGFIGYLVHGFVGAIVASLGTFLPCYLFVVVPAPYYRRIAKYPQIKSFVDGVTASAIGALAGAAFILGKRALIDLPTVIIAIISLIILLKVKKIPEPILIVLAGTAGFLIKGME